MILFCYSLYLLLFAATITTHFLGAVDLFLSDIQLSELERLDKPCATARCQLTIIRFKVSDTSHSAIYHHSVLFNDLPTE